MKLSFPPTAFFPILFGLAELLQEVAWSHWQPPSLTWAWRTWWPSRRCCQMGTGSLGTERRNADTERGGSLRPPQSDIWGVSFLPCLVPTLANTGNNSAPVSPQLQLRGVGERQQLSPLPWLMGGEAAVGAEVGGATQRDMRRKMRCMLGGRGCIFPVSILFSPDASSHSAIPGIHAGAPRSKLLRCQTQGWVW